MGVIVENLQLASLTTLTAAGGPYNVVVDVSNYDGFAFSCTSAATSGATLTLMASVDGVNYAAVPSTIAAGNPVSLTSAVTTIFNVASGALNVRYVQLNLVLGAGNTMATFVVNGNFRSAQERN